MSGRTIVVTGIGQGLGKAIAETLAARGATVIGCGPSLDIGERAHGTGTIHHFTCDIRSEEQVRQFADAALEISGRIDHWINNAGLALTGSALVDLAAEDFERMVAINLLGTMNCCRVAAPLLQHQGEGWIWNMLGAGWDGTPVPGMGGYATTKAALTFLTRSLALEAEGQRYRVGGLSPGLVMTEGFFREHARHSEAERPAREKVVNLIGDHPETIAEWIADCLAGEAANGEILAWLTPERIAQRQAMDPPRDILSAYAEA